MNALSARVGSSLGLVAFDPFLILCDSTPSALSPVSNLTMHVVDELGFEGLEIDELESSHATKSATIVNTNRIKQKLLI